ncbi:uncharacterized protein LOC134283805 [Saccostrea cucullata]|uniref:uncharacterized protein LOC134283805 n=1 Tax=Saccostrea cuccullata TaxID=36930 RepID=UPI002ED4DCE6
MYFTIAGSVLSAFQLAKIIYQIVLNHKRDPAATIPDKIDGKVEVFFTTLFVEIPQNYLLLKYDNIICFNCEIEWNGKKIKRFLNGLSSELASVWRYITSSKCCDGSGGVVKRKVQRSKRSDCCCCSCCSGCCRLCGALCTRMFWSCVEVCFPCVILCHGYEGCHYLTCSCLTYNSGFFWWNCCPCACCYSCCEGPKCKSCDNCWKCFDSCCKCCDNCCTCFDNCCKCTDVSCSQCLIDCLLSIIRFFGGIFTTLYTAMYVLRVLEYFCVVLPTVFVEAFVHIMDTVFGWILN